MSNNIGSSMETPPEQPKKKNTVLIIVIALIILCCCGSAFAFVAWNYGDQVMHALGLY